MNKRDITIVRKEQGGQQINIIIIIIRRGRAGREANDYNKHHHQTISRFKGTDGERKDVDTSKIEEIIIIEQTKPNAKQRTVLFTEPRKKNRSLHSQQRHARTDRPAWPPPLPYQQNTTPPSRWVHVLMTSYLFATTRVVSIARPSGVASLGFPSMHTTSETTPQPPPPPPPSVMCYYSLVR